LNTEAPRLAELRGVRICWGLGRAFLLVSAKKPADGVFGEEAG
jgi:hypothetical protein